MASNTIYQAKKSTDNSRNSIVFHRYFPKTFLSTQGEIDLTSTCAFSPIIPHSKEAGPRVNMNTRARLRHGLARKSLWPFPCNLKSRSNKNSNFCNCARAYDACSGRFSALVIGRAPQLLQLPEQTSCFQANPLYQSRLLCAQPLEPSQICIEPCRFCRDWYSRSFRGHDNSDNDFMASEMKHKSTA